MPTPSSLTRCAVDFVARAASQIALSGAPPTLYFDSEDAVFVTPPAHPFTPPRAVTAPVPVPPPPPLTGPGRRRIPEAELKAFRITLPEPMRKIIEVRGKSGRRYFLSGTIASGTYGKFMYGVNEFGKEFGFKVLRLQPKKAPPKVNAAGEVVKRTRAIERERADTEVNNVQAHSALLNVYDEVEVNGSRYVVMTAMACALDKALKDITCWIRKRLALRATIVSVATEVAEMHRRGAMHTDLKAPNALVDRLGRLALCDFGGVLNLSSTNPDAPVTDELRSSYPAPESPYGKAADVWGLGAMLACAYAPKYAHLFGWSEFPQRQESFKAFRDAVLRPDGSLNLTMVPYGNEWREYFTDFAIYDHRLCAFVLREMLNPTPEERSTIDVVGARLRTIVSDNDILKGRKVLAVVAKQQPCREIFRTLEAYRTKLLAEEARAAGLKRSAMPRSRSEMPPKAKQGATRSFASPKRYL